LEGFGGSVSFENAVRRICLPAPIVYSLQSRPPPTWRFTPCCTQGAFPIMTLHLPPLDIPSPLLTNYTSAPIPLTNSFAGA
jgi:hypothetical protein